MILAAAASVLIVVGLTTWAILHQHNSGQISAVVDLRDRSMARGTEPPPSEPPLEIPRNVSHLEVHLPLGSSEGSYDVRIISTSGEPIVSGRGEAKLEQGLTVLRIDIQVAVGPGKYFFEIRKPASQWISFPLRIT